MHKEHFNTWENTTQCVISKIQTQNHTETPLHTHQMGNNFECWYNMDQVELIPCTISLENGFTALYDKTCSVQAFIVAFFIVLKARCKSHVTLQENEWVNKWPCSHSVEYLNSSWKEGTTNATSYHVTDKEQKANLWFLGGTCSLTPRNSAVAGRNGFLRYAHPDWGHCNLGTNV